MLLVYPSQLQESSSLPPLPDAQTNMLPFPPRPWRQKHKRCVGTLYRDFSNVFNSCPQTVRWKDCICLMSWCSGTPGSDKSPIAPVAYDELPKEDPAHWLLSCRDPGGLDHAKGLPACFVVAPGGVLSEGYGRVGPGVCRSDGQTEVEGVPSQGGCGEALLRHMSPHRICVMH